MVAKVDAAVGAPVEQQQEVAYELSEVARRSPVLLLRLHACLLYTSPSPRDRG